MTTVGTPLSDVIGNNPTHYGAGHCSRVMYAMGYDVRSCEGNGGAQAAMAEPEVSSFASILKPNTLG